MLISYPPQSDSSSDSSTLSGWVGTSSLSLACFALGLCFGFLGAGVGLSLMKPIGSRRFRWSVLVRPSLFSFLTLNTGIPSLGWLKTTYGSCSHLSANKANYFHQYTVSYLNSSSTDLVVIVIFLFPCALFVAAVAT